MPKTRWSYQNENKEEIRADPGRQTKRITENGRAIYLKPSGYAPKRTSKNTWYFRDLQHPICETVYRIGQDYYNAMQDPKTRPRHRVKNTAVLVKLFYWLFLTGARQQEAFIEPFPKLQIINKEGETRVIIQHVNQKHRRKGRTNLVHAAMPIFDEAEQKMWQFITDGGQDISAQAIFKYDKWKSTSKANITTIFKKSFKTDLINPETNEVHKNTGITPHILRHMRSYNVLIDHNLKDRNREIIKIWFGWDNDYMLDYYAHIRNVLQITNQEALLKRDGLLTNLKIDASQIFRSNPSQS